MVTESMISDALRYIGLPIEKADEQVKEKVIQGFKHLEQIAHPKVAYQKMGLIKKADELTLHGTLYNLESQDLKRLLVNCDSCILMAATLGIEVDRKITNLQKLDMLEAMIFDSCASVLVEKLCDEAEDEMMRTLEEGQYLTMRFSPGYGDVPLELSAAILDLLSAQKRIGLTQTKTHMLLPTKSITALIGISSQKENRQKSCGYCTLVKTCMYRRRGDRCGL